MKLLARIKAFFTRPITPLTKVRQTPKPDTPESLTLKRTLGIICNDPEHGYSAIKASIEREQSTIQKVQRIEEIRVANQNRRQKFSNAEHFKQRQPTTSRKLWNPNAKLPTDED